MKPKTFYAYVLRDPRCSTPFYVGKGTGRRAHLHLEGGGHSSLVARKVSKLRREGVEPNVEIIEALDEGHAFFLESCLIEVFGRRDLKTGPLLNLTAGGEGMSGHVQSVETRAKRASKMIGRYYSEETRKKMSLSLKNPSEQTRAKQSAAKKGAPPSAACIAASKAANTGRECSQATREKLRAANSGKPPSPACIEAGRAANLGRSFSEKHIANLKAARVGTSRGSHSEETRAKISAANTGRRLSESQREALSAAHKGKSIRCSNGMVFQKQQHAVAWLKSEGHGKAASSRLSNAAKKNGIAYGFVWTNE